MELHKISQVEYILTDPGATNSNWKWPVCPLYSQGDATAYIKHGNTPYSCSTSLQHIYKQKSLVIWWQKTSA